MADQSQEEMRKARAFKAFQDAARNRDSDPDEFEAAKMRYYFLTKGPEWWQQEKQKIASNKLDPVIAEYRDIYSSLENEASVQRGYTDSIELIKNKQSNIKSEAKKQTSFFDKMLEEQKQKKSAFDRYVELTSPSYAPQPTQPTQEVPSIVQYFASFPSSFNMILNILLGLFGVIILWMGLRKARVFSSMSWNRFTQPVSSGITVIQSPIPSGFGSPR